jgi:hypothetical protein
MKRLSIVTAALLLTGSVVYGYDEGASPPYTVKFGSLAGANNSSSGYYNTFIGVFSGNNNTTGDNNVFIGHYSGFHNTVGDANVFSGEQSGYNITTGHSNVFAGACSGSFSTTGHSDVFAGSYSGRYADVNGSVFLGYSAGYNAARGNTLYIENSSSNSPLICGEFDTNLVRINDNFEFTGTMNAPLVVNSMIDTNDTVTAAFSGSTSKQAL